jgi:hypothetical protein
MGQLTVSTIFNIFSAAVFKIAPAFFTQQIKRAIAEEAIEIITIRYRVAREILAFKISEKPVTILHTEYQ